MRRSRCSILASLPAFALATAVAAGPARAEDPAALFERGMADWKAGRVEEGCKAIGESQRLDPRPGTLFTLATCEAEAGHAATAWARFGEYLALYDHLSPDVQKRQGERPKVARTQRDKLAPQMPELTLVLAPGSPPGTIVKRNGVVLSEASLGVPLPVDAGQYLVTTEAPGAPVREERVTLAPSEKKTVTLVISPKAAPPVAPPPPVAGPSSRRVAAVAAGGIGVAGLLLGAITGGIVLGRKGTLAAHCGTAVGSSDPFACDATGVGAASGLPGLGAASTVGFLLGIAGVGTATVLFLTEPRGTAAQSGRGRWLSVGVASAGAAGTVLRAQGAL